MSEGRVGRPPKKYDEIKTPQLAEEYAKKGLSNTQIAYKLGISESLFYEWQNEFVEFMEAIQRGKSHADEKVINALYQSALGYEYIEESTHQRKRKNGDLEIASIVTTKRYAQPKQQAIEFWLIHRQPQDWADKEKTRETPPPIVNIEIKDNSEVQKEFKKYDT